MPNANLDIYYQRWTALNELLNEVIAFYNKIPVDSAPLPRRRRRAGSAPRISLPRKKLIINLLKRLQAFAAGQFQFFYYGFQPASSDAQGNRSFGQRRRGDPILEVWDEFPPEDILTAIIEQTSHDLALIRRAADQRISPDGRMRETLDEADKLAIVALQPAWQYGVIEKPDAVLTYFEKAAEFYNIPYANVALISIPFTCTSVRKDFLAIPHEAGHYVYRHLVGPLEERFKQMRLEPKASAPYKDWARAVFEEMCADIYGCLVGGPVMALDFQELSLANANDNFIGSDGVHPNPALRPLIYSQVLASDLMTTVSPGNYTEIAQTLAERWNRTLSRRHALTFNITATGTDANFGGGAGGYGIAQAICPLLTQATPQRGDVGDIVNDVVHEIWTYVSQYLKDLDWKNQQRPKTLPTWSGKISADSDPDELQDYFENTRFAELIAMTADDKDLQERNIADAHRAADLVKGRWKRSPKSWRRRIMNENQNLDKQIKWPDAWRSPAQDYVPGNWPNDLTIYSGELRNRDRMEKGTWGYILYANGWAVGGPGQNSGGHPET